MRIELKDWIEENAFLLDEGNSENLYLSKERVLEMMKELREATFKETIDLCYENILSSGYDCNCGIDLDWVKKDFYVNSFEQ